jgi:hypothetical protein
MYQGTQWQNVLFGNWLWKLVTVIWMAVFTLIFLEHFQSKNICVAILHFQYALTFTQRAALTMRCHSDKTAEFHQVTGAGYWRNKFAWVTSKSPHKKDQTRNNYYQILLILKNMEVNNFYFSKLVSELYTFHITINKNQNKGYFSS